MLLNLDEEEKEMLRKKLLHQLLLHVWVVREQELLFQ